MTKLKAMLPYIIIVVCAFYLLPLLIQDTGTGMLILLSVIPVVCFISALIYGAKNGFNIFYSIIIGVLFIPTIFIFYNSTAWVYSVIYGVISIAGNGIGRLI